MTAVDDRKAEGACSRVQIAFEQEIARKVRLNRDSLINTGNAGDMTVSYGVKQRSEDAWEYFHKHIDNPTYLRFAARMAMNAKSNPHERRKLAELGRQAALAQQDAAAVVDLNTWDETYERNAAEAATALPPESKEKPATAKKGKK